MGCNWPMISFPFDPLTRSIVIVVGKSCFTFVSNIGNFCLCKDWLTEIEIRSWCYPNNGKYNEVLNIVWNMLKPSTYSVPAIPVLKCDLSAPKHRARPKSAILGVRFSSRRTLPLLISRWMILILVPWWRYASPSAVPRMILNLCFQFRIWVLFFSTKQISTSPSWNYR